VRDVGCGLEAGIDGYPGGVADGLVATESWWKDEEILMCFFLCHQLVWTSASILVLSALTWPDRAGSRCRWAMPVGRLDGCG